MKFNWHGEVFDKVLHRIGRYTLGHISRGYNLDGWYAHFEINHMEPYTRYKSIYNELNDLWGKTDSESMEKFKNLCKAFESAYKWAIDKYIESLKQEELKGSQVGLL